MTLGSGEGGGAELIGEGALEGAETKETPSHGDEGPVLGRATIRSPDGVLRTVELTEDMSLTKMNLVMLGKIVKRNAYTLLSLFRFL